MDAVWLDDTGCDAQHDHDEQRDGQADAPFECVQCAAGLPIIFQEIVQTGAQAEYDSREYSQYDDSQKH